MRSSNLGYVVVVYNQASGQPDLVPYGSLHWRQQEAADALECEREETASAGRGETYQIAEVVPLDEEPDGAEYWTDIDVITHWLDKANGRSDIETLRRILKVAEELGEVASAYIGTVGQNPRKGVTHTTDDITAELCDVIVTASVALNTITGDHALSRSLLISKLAALVQRTRVRPAEGAKTR